MTGYLLRSLNAEMAAVQQYLAQASLANMWRLQEYGTRFRNDAKDELEHAERLIEQLLMMGVLSTGTQLPPIRPGRSVEEMLLIDRELEIEAIRLYEEAAHYSTRVHAPEITALFTSLLQDELEHLEHLDHMLAELDTGKMP
jgi:bacterioferritin